MTAITIGTRGSKLALTQAEIVAAALRQAHPSLDVQVKIITTQGDRILDVALSKIGDKGLFVKELEIALLNGEIDLAVHSAKDLPSQLPDGLALPAFLPRGDVRDVLVVRATPLMLDAEWRDDVVNVFDHVLPHGAHVGTSSLRRICQLRALRPDLRISDIRGNVDTRLRKLAEGQFDALVLAAAGLERLGFIKRATDGQPALLDLRGLNTNHRLGSSVSETSEVSTVTLVAVPLPTSIMLPAVAQGALAIESRSDDAGTNELIAALNDTTTQAAVLAERAFLRELEGGCQVPIAAFAQITARQLHVTGLVGSLDGITIVRGACAGDADAPEQQGKQLAEQLLADGAHIILDDIRAKQHPRPLEGMHVVITRAAGRNESLAERLRDLGAVPILYPVIAYAPPEDPASLNVALHRLMNGTYDWLVVTSATAVDAVKTWMDDNGQRELPPVRIAVVGPTTAEVCTSDLRRQPVAIPGVFSAENLADAMGDVHGSRVLLLNADIAKPALQSKLQTAGALVDRVIAYRTVHAGVNDVDLPGMLASNELHAITFTSGSTVHHFAERIGPQLLNAARQLIIACIGPSTAEAAREVGLPPTAVATTSTEDGLVEALITAVSAKRGS